MVPRCGKCGLVHDPIEPCRVQRHGRRPGPDGDPHVHLGPDSAGVAREDRINLEALPFRQRLLDESSAQWPVHGSGFGLNLDMKTIPALRGKLYLRNEVYFYREPPVPEMVPKRKSLSAHERDENGELVMEERPIFQDPPFAELHVEISHDGKAWDCRMVLYPKNVPRGGRSEPCVTVEERRETLNEIGDLCIPGILLKVADVASQ